MKRTTFSNCSVVRYYKIFVNAAHVQEIENLKENCVGLGKRTVLFQIDIFLFKPNALILK